MNNERELNIDVYVLKVFFYFCLVYGICRFNVKSISSQSKTRTITIKSEQQQQQQE